MSTSNIILILGAGPNLGISIIKYFSSKGFKTIAVARTPTLELQRISDLVIQADFANPSSVPSIFLEVKAKLGVPNVVVYNAYAVPKASTPFELPLAEFEKAMNIHVTSPFIAMQEAIHGFKILDKETLKTFIMTGNAAPHVVWPPYMHLTLGKRGGAHLIENAAQLYTEEEFRFYFPDERTKDAAPISRDLDGAAAAEFYYELAMDKETKEWEQTFVKGVGYVDFKGVVGDTIASDGTKSNFKK